MTSAVNWRRTGQEPTSPGYIRISNIANTLTVILIQTTSLYTSIYSPIEQSPALYRSVPSRHSRSGCHGPRRIAAEKKKVAFNPSSSALAHLCTFPPGSTMSQPLRRSVRVFPSTRLLSPRARQGAPLLHRAWQARSFQIRAASAEQPGTVNGDSLPVAGPPSSAESTGMLSYCCIYFRCIARGAVGMDAGVSLRRRKIPIRLHC